MCTKDLNEWGNPSKCRCPEKTVYNSKARICLPENTKLPFLMIQGKLAAGLMAIGSETTGFEIQTEKEGVFELVLKTKDKLKLKDLDKVYIEIEGNFIYLPRTEKKVRKAVIVERISVLEK